jgi:signal transduction histidine kinase/DNA-binding response OmpR family regulator/CHASE3 domain sensor protein
MRPLSIRHKVLAGFVLATSVVAALTLITWNFSRQTLEATAFVAHTHDVKTALKEVESNLYRAEAGQRGYIVSGKTLYRDDRDIAIEKMHRTLKQLSRLVVDNAQQQRVRELELHIDRRIEIFREFQDRYEREGLAATAATFGKGPPIVSTARSLLDEMDVAEQRLLREREEAQQQRALAAQLTFGGMMVLIAVLLPLIFWRIRGDIIRREQAEKELTLAVRYESSHSRALGLFNAKSTREDVLAGTLAILAEHHPFPVSAFYAYEEWGGALRLAADRGAPADARPLVRLGEGPIGNAARSGKPVHLEGFDPDTGLAIETGLATLRPAAILLCPVSHHDRLLGVLALAAAEKLAEHDIIFVERLTAQLGVALHNLKQVDDLKIMADQLRFRGEEIQAKNAQLEEAGRMKSEFLANMSHELRTPLNAIIGFSDVLKDGLVGELGPEQKECVTDINSSGRHLLSLVNDILDLSKIESGQMTLDLEPMDPAQLAASGIGVVREQAMTRRIHLDQECLSSLGQSLLDARKTKQIIYNLLSNAVKFTPDGGSVDLALRKIQRGEIDRFQPAADTRLFPPRDARHDMFLEISVTDSGIGIAPEDLARLFEPFVQIDSSLSRQHEGTGLGLAMVRRLAEIHGGGAMAQSTPGKGSRFTVWLPWRAPEAAEPAEPTTEPAATPRGEAPVVLLVEDDPRAASVFRLQLEAAGHRVEHVRNAEDGLRLAAELRPDAIVLDIILPGADGWDMLARLKASPDTRSIPVVIVSVTDDPRRGFALGAAQVLVKPVSQEELACALASLGLDKQAQGARVLVVDDDPKAVALVSTYLKAAGFSPLGAYGGREGIDLALNEPPAVIVLDLLMPDVSGFDVVDALRARPETADIPLLVLTAKLLTSEDRAQLRGQVLRIMEKSSFEPKFLVAEVKRALATRKPRQ